MSDNIKKAQKNRVCKIPYIRHTLTLDKQAKFLYCKLSFQQTAGTYGSIFNPSKDSTHHIKGGKHVTVVVIGLQIFCDISKC